ncbi:tRNA methyltransferase complex GCD14 subunit [Laetiporus sulphureus 93-53]|uniref:tRNA (adenine(58)-N(1))-methyltransferase catalytic subunit TRM61 n=1 Tax=Laetiporus sulphureus 93-53 TaxID=1314785 RepID=A0A165HKC7_9APHY|nr:tRNA methyltransferase complex GCD14 subunit [Laetiporus sulphureus 93-53]KZT11844.1 tRNA methyltransferase complex GCD14 subunit [Laetiporus sulphureus 93-53]
MWSTARDIAAGDLVIVWLTRELLQPLVITPGKEFNSKFGVYRHSDLVGVPYGSKIGSRNGKGFIHVLRPTPELWTLALPHRTQILYLADIAFVCSWLNIKPGSRVIEAGTGSGSFSHSVARTIGPTGHLWSYEFHEARANKAREEFTRHGMDDIVTLTHRNVCKDGFTVTDTVDAVFLDLPAPWEAVDHAKKALRKDRIARICCFSPCMEQVLRTVNALNDAGFTDITMYETLSRPHQVDSVPPPLPISAISAKLKKTEQRREDKRLRQIAQSRAAAANKRKRADDAEHDSDADPVGGKRPKMDDEEQAPTPSENTLVVSEEELQLAESSLDAAEPLPLTKMSLSKAFPEVRGHTSYLTFACLLPMPQGAPTGETPADTTEETSAVDVNMPAEDTHSSDTAVIS